MAIIVMNFLFAQVAAGWYTTLYGNGSVLGG